MQVEARGLVFDVEVDGPQDGPPVLLLHGFPQTSHCWRHVELSGFRTVAPDQRGYSPGARPLDVESYRVPELVADALGVLDALGIAKAHVVGHDWGAGVAWQLGARHAERVETLTILSVPHPAAFRAALHTDDEQRQKSAYMRDFAQPGYDQVLLADDAAALRAVFGGLPSVDVEHVIARAQEPGALAAWLRWYAGQRREDVQDTPAVAVPTLYVWSDGDLALGRTAALETAHWVTGPYRFEVLEGVSHWIPEEAADRLSALLLEHLG
ncbi:MAG: alpha/beta hydrolase fold protein [Frankiales bacterium]|nr:alpha/beta hydrolase fold protein [Frankiales bacterium]